jgi:hypothetical protein
MWRVAMGMSIRAIVVVLGRYQFRQVRARLRANDPIGLRQRHGDRKRSHKPPIYEVPRGKCGAGERHFLTIGRRVDKHARTIQNLSVKNVRADDAGGVKPVCPENVVRIDLMTESHNHPRRWWRCHPFFSIC